MGRQYCNYASKEAFSYTNLQCLYSYTDRFSINFAQLLLVLLSFSFKQIGASMAERLTSMPRVRE